MLLKYPAYQRRSKLTATGKLQRSTGAMKVLNGKGKGHRKGKGTASKRLHQRASACKLEEINPLTTDPCDNSNDSGLGFDHLDYQAARSSVSFTGPEYFFTETNIKRQRLDIKLESDNANDEFTFPSTRIHPVTTQSLCLPTATKIRAVSSGKGGKYRGQASLNQSAGVSRDGSVHLQILSQPEMQHRARYQTEGSRGAVKDRTGNGFPMVKLSGYNKPTTLEVYIGTDQGRVAPHMFYQACRVSGKNSTPCIEKKVDGTVLIEVDFDPSKDMVVTCDCVGILKERNVDVEHRFPEESSGRSKKKSTRCRMVFRTTITNPDGTAETLQVTSQPIICTQPPGVPEISKKSLISCPASGGVELFILGKNFLKDTSVVFSEGERGSETYWESPVTPDKEFLQQSHLVCIIPPYRSEIIKEPVVVKMYIVSSGRSSEAHNFFYTPNGTSPMQVLNQDVVVPNLSISSNLAGANVFPSQNLLVGVPLMVQAPPITPRTFLPEEGKVKEESGVHPVMLWTVEKKPIESEIMPPPSTLPVSVRRSSQTLIIPDIELKREPNSPTGSVPSSSPTSDLSASQQPSLDTLRRFVSTPNAPLPALSVETYFSRIESKHMETNSGSNLLGQVGPVMGSSLYTEPQGVIKQQMVEPLLGSETSKLNSLVSVSTKPHLSPPGSSQIPNGIESSPPQQVSHLPVQSPINLSHQEAAIGMNSSTTISQLVGIEPKLLSPPTQTCPQSSPICHLLTEGGTIPPLMSPHVVSPTQEMSHEPLVPQTAGISALQQQSTPPPAYPPPQPTTQEMVLNVPQQISPPPFPSPRGEVDIQPAPEDLRPTMILPNHEFPQPHRGPETLLSESVNQGFLRSGIEKQLIDSPLQRNSQLASAQLSPNIILNSNHEQFALTQVIKQENLPSPTGSPKYQETIVLQNHFPPNATVVGEPLNVNLVASEAPGIPPSFQTAVFPPAQTYVNDALTGIATGASAPLLRPESVVAQSFQTQEIRRVEPLLLTQEGTIKGVGTAFTTQGSDLILSTSRSFETSGTGPTVIQVREGDTRASVPTATSQGAMVQVDVPPGNVLKPPQGGQVKKVEEGIPLPQELTQMSENDLLSYINPSCFDQV